MAQLVLYVRAFARKTRNIEKMIGLFENTR